MPPIKSLASKCCAYVISVIFSLGEIMFTYSRCIKKKLVYIIIIAPFSRQLSSCLECIKSNMRLSYNIRSVLDAKCL